MFQSTHPRGVRLEHFCKWQLTQSFNPRTRVGCDDILRWSFLRRIGFNPRTRVGCDNKKVWFTATSESFNPRTRVGCD